jgi:hypothetical protein
MEEHKKELKTTSQITKRHIAGLICRDPIEFIVLTLNADLIQINSISDWSNKNIVLLKTNGLCYTGANTNCLAEYKQYLLGCPIKYT